jgi:hypothetical protein
MNTKRRWKVKTETEEGHHLGAIWCPEKRARSRNRHTLRWRDQEPSRISSACHSKISTEKPGPGREEKSPARWQMNSRKHLAATQQLGRQEKLKTEVKNAGGAEKSTAGPGVAL